MKTVSGFICFGLGVAFSIAALTSFKSVYFNSADVGIPGMLGAMLLLGAFSLLRRPNVTANNREGNGRRSDVRTFTASKATTERAQEAASGFIKLIGDDPNPNEVRASAYALAGLAGFLVGFAAAKVGASLEDFLKWCRDSFEQSARRAYQGHAK
jgi:hypothetical protein